MGRLDSGHYLVGALVWLALAVLASLVGLVSSEMGVPPLTGIVYTIGGIVGIAVVATLAVGLFGATGYVAEFTINRIEAWQDRGDQSATHE